MKNYIEYIFALLLILNCNSVYSVMDGKNFYLKEMLLGVTFILLIVHIFLKDYKKEKSGNEIAFLIFYVLYIILYVLIKEVRAEFIYLYLILLPVMYFIYATSSNNEGLKILIKISQIVYILSIISLIFYILGTIMNVLPVTKYLVINWGEKRNIASYCGLHFNIQKESVGNLKIYRNTSIFTEAPMFSLFLVISLCIELFFSKKVKTKKIITLIIVTITTLSTTGIILSTFLCFIYYINKKNSEKFKKYFKILSFPLIIFLVAIVVSTVFNNKFNSSSYNTRIDDYRASYYAFKDEPLFGNGFKNDDAIIAYMSSFRGKNVGLSNSIMVLLAQCGIYIFVIYLYPFLKVLFYGIKNKKRNLIILDFVILILFITTIFLYKPIIINFMALGYAINKSSKETKDCERELV